VKKIKSYAKINLFLKVIGRQKKYHKLYSLISQIDLYDEIYIKENDYGNNKLFFSGKYKVNTQKNTVIDLLKILKKKFPILRNKYFNIHIKKNIPNGSGLGGASSNATAIFNFIKKKYKLKISIKRTHKLLSLIGKDCPLFLNQKVKIIKSHGENFTELSGNLKLHILLIYPNIVLSTKKVFYNLKKISNISQKKGIDLNDKTNLFKICKFYGNDLLSPALKIEPRLKILLNLINKINDSIFYSMTGSGSAFFIIFSKKKSLLNAQKMIKKQGNKPWTKIVKTI